MENVLLHSCCAPCSAAIVEWMLAQDIRPTLYYFNPNIFPQEEYEIRKSECSRYAQKLGLEIIDGDYDHTAWLSDVAGLEDVSEFNSIFFACNSAAHTKNICVIVSASHFSTKFV